MARAFAEGIFFNKFHDHINMGLEKCRFQKSRLGYGYVQREKNAKEMLGLGLGLGLGL